jgi:nitrite reductase/ring-hydroxylating ferredoxin subunit
LDEHAYADGTLFERELEHIFARSWLYVGHETEIPGPSDFKTTWIGREPVIVNRDRAGAVQVMLNRCAHQATTLCHQRRGSTEFFRCRAHGWTYDAYGTLLRVPYVEDFGAGFDLSDHGLARVGRVASHRGFVFASLADAGPGLLEHLGQAAPWLDRAADRGFGVPQDAHRSICPGNWKLHHHLVPAGPVSDWVDLGGGHARTEEDSGPGAALSIFPNVLLTAEHVRVVHPVKVDSSLVEIFPVGAADAGGGEAFLERHTARGSAPLSSRDR